MSYPQGIAAKFKRGLRPPPALMASQRKILDGLVDDDTRYQALELYVGRHRRWRSYGKDRQARIVEGLMAQYRTRMTPWELFNEGRV